jgi:hypothetical protein
LILSNNFGGGVTLSGFQALSVGNLLQINKLNQSDACLDC